MYSPCIPQQHLVIWRSASSYLMTAVPTRIFELSTIPVLLPLLVALYNEHFAVAQWLIRNGALSVSSDDAGVIDDATMRRDLYPQRVFENWSYDRRLTVLSWAQDAVTNHANVELFLKGTILPSASFRRHPKNEYVTRSKRMKLSSSSSSSSSPLVMLKGKSGILELISKYVGNPKPQK